MGQVESKGSSASEKTLKYMKMWNKTVVGGVCALFLLQLRSPWSEDPWFKVFALILFGTAYSMY